MGQIVLYSLLRSSDLDMVLYSLLRSSDLDMGSDTGMHDERSKEYRTIRASNCILARTHARTYKETRILVEHVSILLADSAPIKL